MNKKIKFNALLLFFIVSLIACTSKKEEKSAKQDQSQPILNKSEVEHGDVNPGPIDSTTYIFDVVEQMPQFPGGEQKLLDFISRNLKYPAIALDNDIQGRVIVRFVVTRTGTVDKCEVVRSLDPGCDKEALRVVRLLPKWIPGKQNGVNVNTYYTLPITYKLE